MGGPVIQQGRSKAAAVLLLASLPALPCPSAAQDPGAEAARPAFVDSVEVNQVSVEVLVTDRKDRRIFDLTRDDFEVFEDGRRVEISHFRAPSAPAPRGGEPDGVAAGPAEDPPPPAVAAEPPLPLLLFVDPPSLRPSHRRKLFETFRESLSAETAGLRLMLVTWDGRLRVRHGFDSPTAEVLATLAELEGGRVRSRAVDQARIDELAGAAAELDAVAGGTALQLESAQSRRDTALAELEAVVEGERLEIERRLDVLRQLVFSLGGVAGRKSILYAGDSLTMAPASELVAAANLAFGPGSSASAAVPLDLFHDFKSLVRQANASGVSFHTLTPPSQQHLGDVAVGQVGPVGYQGAIRSEREDRIKEAACLMSHTTGGRCQAGGTDFSLLVDGAVEDLRAVYSLGYVPQRRPDGEYHRIEVRLKARGLRARHREGYLDRTAGDRLRERLAAALWFGAEEDRLGVELTVEEQRAAADSGSWVVPIQVTVPAQRFSLLPATRPGTLSARGRLLVVAAAADGRVTATDEFPVSFEVAAEKLAGAPLLYAHRIDLRLRRGSHKVAVGVWDEIGRQGSFQAVAFTAGKLVQGAAAAAPEPR